MTTTPTVTAVGPVGWWSLVVDELHDAGQDVRVGFGEHAMAEVEDVRWMTAVVVEHLAHLRLDHRTGGKAHGRIEVALQRDVTAQAFASSAQGRAPVDTDDVRAGLSHRR